MVIWAILIQIGGISSAFEEYAPFSYVWFALDLVNSFPNGIVSFSHDGVINSCPGDPFSTVPKWVSVPFWYKLAPIPRDYRFSANILPI